MEKLWGHVLTSTLPLHADNWYNKVTDLIEKQQTAPIWMSDSKVTLPPVLGRVKSRGYGRRLQRLAANDWSCRTPVRGL